MAIEYTLALNAPDGPMALTDELVKHLSLQSESGPLPTVSGDGIVCTALAQSTLGRELVQETFGIDSTVSLICRLDKFDLLAAGMDQLVAINLCLLTKRSGDVVLLANGEKGLLLRKSGEIFVDCRDDYWKRKWELAFSPLGIPLRERDLPLI